MNLRQKEKWLRYSIKERRSNSSESDSKGLALVLTISGFMFLYGYMIGTGSYQEINYIGDDFDTSIDEAVQFKVQDQVIKFLPRDHKNMENRVGYVKAYSDNSTMWLQADRPIEEIYQTCNHEELHNRGVLGDNHDYIYQVQDQIYNPLCLEAVYRFGQYTGSMD